MEPEDILHAVALDEVDANLEQALHEWRDAGAPVEHVVAAINDLVDARVDWILSSRR